MDINENIVRNHEHCHTLHRGFCWSGVIAGALVGVGLGFLLNLFGVAIGLSAYSSSTTGAEVIATGGFIGMLIGVIASMGAAGFVSGYVGKFHNSHCHGGVIYGFVTWSLALMLAVLLIAPTTSYVTNYENSLNPTVAPIEVTNSVVGDKVVTGKKRPASEPVVSVQAKHLAYSGWLIFVLFFIGALSSCIGACMGMGCRKKEVVEVVHTHPNV